MYNLVPGVEAIANSYGVIATGTIALEGLNALKRFIKHFETCVGGLVNATRCHRPNRSGEEVVKAGSGTKSDSGRPGCNQC